MYYEKHLRTLVVLEMPFSSSFYIFESKGNETFLSAIVMLFGQKRNGTKTSLPDFVR